MAGASRLGDQAQVQQDAHGCPACPHPGVGPAIAGSANVLVNGRPAVRLNDVGIHAVCCGQNMWSASQGSTTVFINGQPAVRNGDQTKHCGGMGKMIQGSDDVIIGGPAGTGSSSGSSTSDNQTTQGSSSGGGGGGGAATASSGSAASSPATSSSSGSSSASAGASTSSSSSFQPGSEPSSSPSQQSQQQKDEDVFVLAAQLKSPGGTPLAFEQVAVFDRDGQQVGDLLTTDETGRVSVTVPKDSSYGIQIVDDDIDDSASPSDDTEATAHVHCQIFDANHQAVVGESVKVTGNGLSLEVTTGDQGDISTPATPGEYELEIRNQAFKVHTLYLSDLSHPHGGSPYQLVLADEDEDHEKARLDRYSPSEREED